MLANGSRFSGWDRNRQPDRRLGVYAVVAVEASSDCSRNWLLSTVLVEEVLSGWVDLKEDVISIRRDPHVDRAVLQAKPAHQLEEVLLGRCWEFIRLDRGLAESGAIVRVILLRRTNRCGKHVVLDNGDAEIQVRRYVPLKCDRSEANRIDDCEILFGEDRGLARGLLDVAEGFANHILWPVPQDEVSSGVRIVGDVRLGDGQADSASDAQLKDLSLGGFIGGDGIHPKAIDGLTHPLEGFLALRPGEEPGCFILNLRVKRHRSNTAPPDGADLIQEEPRSIWE